MSAAIAEPRLERSNAFRPPREIWGLRDRGTGELILADDEVGEPFIAFKSRDDAQAWANDAAGGMCLDADPVRLK